LKLAKCWGTKIPPRCHALIYGGMAFHHPYTADKTSANDLKT
jgi:hypothetical protein